MENNRFELQENDFEVIEAPCAKCAYNCGALFGCDKYDRIPAPIRIGEQPCDYRLLKVDFVNTHLNVIKQHFNEKEILVSYPMYTLINDTLYFLYLVLLIDGTVLGKIAIDEKNEIFKVKEFSEKRIIEGFDKEKYVSLFSKGIDLYTALLESQKMYFCDEALTIDITDRRAEILELINKDMDEFIHILKKINPDFFELLAK